MSIPPRAALLLLAPALLPAGGCLLFDEDPCAQGTEPGCVAPEPEPVALRCEGGSDPRCEAPKVCRPDPASPCEPGTACPDFCLLPRTRCTAPGQTDCLLADDQPCTKHDDCFSEVCSDFQPGGSTCMNPCSLDGGAASGCAEPFRCLEHVLPDGRTVNACGAAVHCSSDRACAELGLGRCVVTNGASLRDGRAAATCSSDEGEDDTGRNCSLPGAQHPVHHSDLCPVRGLCFRSCENNDSEACNEGICTRPCQRDSDCPDRMFCSPFDRANLEEYFPQGAPQFKICQLRDSNVDYEWGCKDQVDCCSGLQTATVQWGPPPPPDPPFLTFPIQYDYRSTEVEKLRCCIKSAENECTPYPDPYSVESHCSLVSTPGGALDQPPPRLATQCLSNLGRDPVLALPGAPCADGSECLTHLCAGGRCTTPCYTEPWPNSPDRDPTCPALPDGTSRVCCPGRVPFFDTGGVGRSCASGESCPAGTACWEGSCQVCIATCQLGAGCPAGGDPTCTGPL